MKAVGICLVALNKKLLNCGFQELVADHCKMKNPTLTHSISFLRAHPISSVWFTVSDTSPKQMKTEIG